jgi:hypothetical protein
MDVTGALVCSTLYAVGVLVAVQVAWWLHNRRRV